MKPVPEQRSNHRIQATAGGAAVLSSRVRRAPAAPDAERYANSMRIGRSATIALTISMSGATAARADAFDLPFLLDARRPWTLGTFVATLAFFMLGNFALNFLFVGLPAAAVGRVPWRPVIKGIAGITFVGQVADILGRYVATKAAQATAGLDAANPSGLSLFFTLNLALSGLIVGMLVWFWARHYWRLRLAGSLALSGIAAVLTNPGWATGYWIAAGWADHVA